jgi:hypothetical protein
MKKLIYNAIIITAHAAPLYPHTLQADPDKTPQKSDVLSDNQKILDSLKKAQSHLGDAFRVLGEKGVKSYKENLPELKKQSAELLDNSQKLIENWRKKLDEELAEKLPKKPEKSAPKAMDNSKSMPLI